jgi:hypothetical protein
MCAYRRSVSRKSKVGLKFKIELQLFWTLVENNDKKGLAHGFRSEFSQ